MSITFILLSNIVLLCIVIEVAAHFCWSIPKNRLLRSLFWPAIAYRRWRDIRIFNAMPKELQQLLKECESDPESMIKRGIF